MWYLRKYYWFRLEFNVKWNNFLAYCLNSYWKKNAGKYMLTAYWYGKWEDTH